MQKTHEELVQLKQDGKISWTEFLLQGEYAEDYKAWLDSRGEQPTEDNAEFFYDMSEASFWDSQDKENNKYYEQFK